ncbi:integration host factor subunit beta [Roseibaca sp. V10]|uniref:Integration host factor subunit beta n=1 Tax=Roseinatronobacter domitianus TaxID=2940293 RepID=A0ABT0M3Q9_9RHOB|nr:HU family DNA-binding protein [Roseibaca domitiana]MCL1629480.1 integration host factor subunit beta [Roseibaca domitiana]
MIRSELIQCLTEQYPDLTHKDATRVVDVIFGEITAALSCGGRVEIRGFGSFFTVVHDARTGRNPRTGASVEIAEKRAIRFKTGKGLRDRLNPGGDDDGQA